KLRYRLARVVPVLGRLVVLGEAPLDESELVDVAVRDRLPSTARSDRGIDGGVPAALAAAPVAGGAMSECLLPRLAGGRAASLSKRFEIGRPRHELRSPHEMRGGLFE